MNQYIAKTFTGLEKLLAAELKELGATDLEIQNRGVAFSGTPRIMYRVNLESRLALKVLSEIVSFEIEQAQDVYTKSKEIEWEKYIPEGKTFAIDTDVFSSFFDNTMYAALICKDAIVDRIREVRDERPTVDKKDPDIDITLFIRDTSVTISLNSSGQSLHIRGYKKYPGIAPLSEVLAAGLIQLTGWDKESPLLNPMCGSGSLMIEAQRYARNIPSQINRKSFSFQHWPNYDEERWELILKGAKMRVNRNSPEIIGFDFNNDAVQGAKKNALTAGSFKSLQIYNHDFFKYEPPLEHATAIINPPYNVRLKVEDQLRFYNQINNMLYRHYKSYDNWIICPVDINLRKAGFRVEKELIVYNGPIKCQFAKLSFASKRDNPNRDQTSRDQTSRGGSDHERPFKSSDAKGGSGHREKSGTGRKWDKSDSPRKWDKPRSGDRPDSPRKWDKPRSGDKPDFPGKWDKPRSGDRPDSPRKWNKPGSADRPDSPRKWEKPGSADRPDSPRKWDKPRSGERSGPPKKWDKPRSGDRPDSPGKWDKPRSGDRSGPPKKWDKPRSGDKPDFPGKWDKPRSADRPDSPGKWDKPRSGDRSGPPKKWDKPRSADRPDSPGKWDKPRSGERSGPPKKWDKPRSADRPDSPGKWDKPRSGDRSGPPKKWDKPRSGDRPDSPRKWDKPGSGDKSGPPKKWDKPGFGDKSGSPRKWNKSDSAGQRKTDKGHSGKTNRFGKPGFRRKPGGAGKRHPKDQNPDNKE